MDTLEEKQKLVPRIWERRDLPVCLGRTASSSLYYNHMLPCVKSSPMSSFTGHARCGFLPLNQIVWQLVAAVGNTNFVLPM
jgi:hypothetical protein